MIGKSVSSPKPIPLAQVEELLAKRSGEGEFGYEQQKSLEYAKRFAKVSARKAAEMLSELEEMGVPYEVAVKIVDVVPRHAAQLRVIVGNSGVSEDKQKKIREMLSKVKVKHVEGAKKEEVAAKAGEGEGEKESEAGKEASEAAAEGEKEGEEVGAGGKDASEGKKEGRGASEKEEGAGKKGKEEKKEKKAKKEKE